MGIVDRDAFLRFVGLCFRQKRKTLRNNLAEAYGRDLVESWPEASLRAEQLSRWEALAGTGRQLWVLRLVAGQGRTINSLGSGGSARLANTKALTEVLRAIAEERGLRR